jgi:filamentous hemagglutinin family protein
MKRGHWLNNCSQSGFVGILAWLSISVFACKTLAQSSNILPDNTLGFESSQVTPNYEGEAIEVITGGATRGINLFHSFREFNVSEGRGAYFLSPNADIQNILSRVTGSNKSEILGTLGTFGESQPNLFLINPNGIVFGENASLDVQGSFAATTANAVQFGSQGNFSATNPQVPSQLLTINPSAFLFNQINQNAGIQNKSFAPAGTDPKDFDIFGLPLAVGLRVPDGKSLLLVGGNVLMNKGRLISYNGRVELGGLSQMGTVGVNVNNKTLSLNFSENAQMGDIELANGSYIDVRAQGSGEIIINANKLDISDSDIYAGRDFLNSSALSQVDGNDPITETGSEFESNVIKSGNIQLNATGAIAIFNSSFIYTESPKNTEKLGEINIKSHSLTIQNSLIRTNDSTFYKYSGDININTIDSVNIVGSTVLAKTRLGKPGNLRINTKKLFIREGGQVATLSLTEEKGGSLDVNASEQIVLSGSAIDEEPFIVEYPSGLYTVTLGGTGGDLNISTPKLTVQDGAVILTRTDGGGNAGNIAINALNLVELKGTSSIDLPSGIFNLTESSGASGNTTVNTQKLTVQNGAQIANSLNNLASENKISFAEPPIYYRTVDGGLGTSIMFTGSPENIINIAEERLGNAGNLTINADSVHLSGASSNGRFVSGLFAQAPSSSSAGDININADKMTLEKGAQISASTFGEGQGGNLNVNTLNFIGLKGTSANGLPSGLFTQTSGKGSAGNIIIKTINLDVTDGSVVSTGTTTDSQGDGGDVNINASESVFISGTSKDGLPTGLSASTRGIGASGNINITTNNLRVQEGAVVSVTTNGSGAGGKLNVNAVDAVELLGMSADKTIPSGLFARTFSTGNAGDLEITTNKLTLRDGAQVTVSSLSSNKAGDLEITADNILLDNQAKLIAETLSGDGGNINLNISDLLLMRRGSQISTSAGTAQQGGDGGNIDINSRFIVAVPEENSDISANAFTGAGGNVQITSRGVFGIEARSQVSDRSDITASSERGVQGVTTINAPDNSGIQNSLNQLSENPIDPNALIANSCIARRNNPQNSTFFITGKGGLPERPGEAPISQFSTGTMQNIPKGNESATDRPWKIGDPIVEPTGVYRLANGKRVLSRECD